MKTGGALVIGIGNRLRGDDALGPIVADELRRRSSIPVREHTGESLSLMGTWNGAEVVVLVDAVRSGGEAGAIHRLDLTEEPLAISPWTFSTHAFSLAETLELARTLGRLPPRLLFFGVEGVTFDVGAEMSPAVAAVVPRLVEEIVLESVGIES